MKLNEIVEKLGLTIINRGKDFEREVTGGYTSDLLSDVMGNIDEDMLWITLQVHRNTIAVASLKEIAGVVLIGDAKLDEDTLAQAKSEEVTVLATEMPAFETSGRIYELIK